MIYAQSRLKLRVSRGKKLGAISTFGAGTIRRFGAGRRSRLIALLTTVGIVGGVVGCSRGDRPEIGEVTGRVTFDGKPLEGALVAFYPDHGCCVGGIRMPDGRYELLYLHNVKGAKVGHHVVKITTTLDPSDENFTPEKSRELVPPWYNVRSIQEANVEPGENEIDFQLSTKMPEG